MTKNQRIALAVAIFIVAVLVAMWLAPRPKTRVVGGVCTATAGDWSSVANCFAAVVDGETVVIPAGTYHATSTIKNDGKGITVQGETTCTDAALDTTCIDKTILVDDVANSGRFFNNSNIGPGKVLRYTGLTFTGGTGSGYDGFLSIGGTTNAATGGSRQCRVDNYHVTGQIRTSRGLEIYSGIRGVSDHFRYDQVDRSNPQNCQNKVENGSYPYGDEEWTRPAGWGTDDFWFVESGAFHMDSGTTFSAAYGWDGHRASKFIIRHCHLYGVEILCHGTENGRDRGGRAMELSYNDYHWPYATDHYDGTRSGVAVYHDNIADGGDCQGWGQQMYRLFNNYDSVWLGADGFCAWDNNDPGNPKDTGTCTAFHRINNGTTEVTDSSKNWQPNQWVGYSFSDAGGTQTKKITANSTNVLTLGEWGDPCCLQDVPPGTSYRIGKVLQGVDQPGAGPGDLLPNETQPTPRNLHQSMEGSWAWNNKYTGPSPAHDLHIVSLSATCVEGGSMHNGQRPPGYAEYPYPHPLVTGGVASPTPQPTATSAPQPTAMPTATATPTPVLTPTPTATSTPPPQTPTPPPLPSASPTVSLPSPPSSLVANSGPPKSAITINWQNNDPTANAVLIERSTDGSSFSQVEVLAAAQTSYTDRGLVSGQTYWYRVKVRNPLGTSADSNIASASAK